MYPNEQRDETSSVQVLTAGQKMIKPQHASWLPASLNQLLEQCTGWMLMLYEHLAN